MSALVTDLKDLCEQEEPIYVAIAVAACVRGDDASAGWLAGSVRIPGQASALTILINLGSNGFLGQISYITKALSAVLQLAVTMDYSIFLWHSYNEQRELLSRPEGSDGERDSPDADQRWSVASLTTVAGFIALCFMTFTLGTRPGHRNGEGRCAGRYRLRNRAAFPDSDLR